MRLDIIDKYINYAIFSIVLSVRKDCLLAPESSLFSVELIRKSSFIFKTSYDDKNYRNYKRSLKRGVV